MTGFSRYKERPDAIYIYISVLTILIALTSPYKSTKSVQVLVAAECHAARSSGVTSQQRDRRPLHSGQHRDTGPGPGHHCTVGNTVTREHRHQPPGKLRRHFRVLATLHITQSIAQHPPEVPKWSRYTLNRCHD